MTSQIQITKHNGETVSFSESKLRESLIKSGASEETINVVIDEVTESLTEGISTRHIYQKAHKLLKKRSSEHASRYKLKQSILELGPSGYPFEHFVGELFKIQGYEISTGVISPGHCVQHEVDVIADNGTERFMIECKFHNRNGYKTDVKVPLYIQSRFLDVSGQWRLQENHNQKKMIGWVVTNSRFTTDAIDFGKCVGLRMLGWDYPGTDSLKILIEKFKIQPITTLSSLNRKDRELLFKEGIVLCRNICEQSMLVERLLGRSSRQLLKEANYICSYP